tara:strand:- start:523 stop:723 length:201 start_codon:yes stop_codon:yes gene_type:complete
MLKILILTFLIFFNYPAFAYLGPGMGAGIVLATIGFIVAIFAALFAIIWFPIKRLIKKNKKNKDKR